MKTILAQQLLLNGMSRQELFSRHAVHVKPHNGKVSLIYDQIEAKPSDPVACQCRGMVLREGTWELLAYPFDRFFNHGQQEAAPINLQTAAFQEKLDGTLVIAYWDDRDSRWHTATRSLTEAHLGNNGLTFRELADKAAAEMGRGSIDDMLADVPHEYTLMFELTAPENQVVCEYRERRLTLLGMRDIRTLEEVNPDGWGFTSYYNFERPQQWRFDNLDHIAEVIKDWDPGEYEGVVAVDAEFNRVKVKSPRYLAVHHATDSLGSSWRSCLGAVVSGAADDIEAYVPRFVADRIEVCRDRVHKLIERTEADLAKIRHIDDMKQFAEQAKGCEFPSALFAVKRGNCDSVSTFVERYNVQRLAALCGLESEK